MRALIRLGIVAVLLGMCGGAPLAAQSATTGALAGRVEDAAGAPLEGARVTLVAAGGGLVREATADAAGGFHFAFVAPGTYRLTVEREGRAAWSAPVTVRGSEEAWVALSANASGDGFAGSMTEAAARAGSGQGAFAPHASPLPLGPRGDLVEAARLDPTLDAFLGAEGLPGTLSTLLVDGVPFRPAAHPLQRLAPWASTAFPLLAFSAVEVATDALDVEWPGAAGAVLAARSGVEDGVSPPLAAAAWNGGALPGASAFDGSARGDVRAAARTGWSADDGRARIAFGGRGVLRETPHAAAWPSSDAARALAGTAGSGVLLADPTVDGAARADAFGLFGRLDWQAAPEHRLALSAHVAGVPRAEAPAGAALVPGFGGPLLEGVDVIAGATLASTSGGSTSNLARLAFTHSERSAGDTDAVAPTFLAQEGLALGAWARSAEGRETRLHLSNTLLHRSGAHTLSVGASLSAAAIAYDFHERRDGAFHFGSAALLAARTGAWMRSEGPSPMAEWGTTDLALFAQDRWRVRDGLELLVGARLERRGAPGEVARDGDWLALTGVSNAAFEGPGWRVTPRVGARWDVTGDGRWTLDAQALTRYDAFDPLLLAQWQTDAGSLRMRRTVGPVTWPDAGGGGAPLRTLTVLAPELDAPRTSRISLSLAHRLDDATTLEVGAVARRTKGLARRTDLNLLPLPSAHDAHGRPLFGMLVKQGALVAAVPGSGRRFAGYDEVVGVAADGISAYQALTLGVEHRASDALTLLARYALSRTRDDVFGGGWDAAAPAGFDEDWLSARSDFDVPHRLVVGAELAPVPALHVGALYRYASGRPFTPGFRAAVDANGDGVFGNDPAFVDGALPGMATLVARWPCLRETARGFAERNACRASGTHTLDATAEWTFARLGGAAARLSLEAFDLLGDAPAPPDAALLLVDPAAGLQFDAASGQVTVPLLLNPEFGQPLDHPRPGRLLRVGLSLTW